MTFNNTSSTASLGLPSFILWLRSSFREKKTLELDKYEYGVIFHALKDERNQMIKEGRPSDAVDDVLLKVIELIEEPPEKEKRGRKCHEER